MVSKLVPQENNDSIISIPEWLYQNQNTEARERESSRNLRFQEKIVPYLGLIVLGGTTAGFIMGWKYWWYDDITSPDIWTRILQGGSAIVITGIIVVLPLTCLSYLAITDCVSWLSRKLEKSTPTAAEQNLELQEIRTNQPMMANRTEEELSQQAQIQISPKIND